MSRTLHLNAFLMGVGHHEAAWRHPRADPSRLADVRHFQELARIAERGTLDSVFLADGSPSARPCGTTSRPSSNRSRCSPRSPPRPSTSA
ncbi:hypothetical protein V2I01_25060 [Micromonospora sp. BRA006-A]|nr:hypothetical protein [Micromonospora sp. BRA006-A]